MQPRAQSKQSERDSLEATAYALILLGCLKFEAQRWRDCLVAHSGAHFIYSTLEKSVDASRLEDFRYLSNTYIEPSIRYAAYQSKVPRTLSIARIVSQYVPADAAFKRYLPTEDFPAAEEGGKEGAPSGAQNVPASPSSISWRSRTVKLEDARIAQALGSVSVAEKRLASSSPSAKDSSPKDRAAAYDSVLNPSQDAVDATNDAISEMASEGVPLEDPRMQALYITRTAVNYAMINWRVGRNRVLCGRQDGASWGTSDVGREIRHIASPPKKQRAQKGKGSQLKRLKERVVLYDSTLQSLEAILELQGVANDTDLVNELRNRSTYFGALRYDADTSERFF